MNPTEISNEAREAAEAICNIPDAWTGGIEGCKKAEQIITVAINAATKELREQLAASHAELERLRDIVGEEDAASINAVLGESRNP